MCKFRTLSPGGGFVDDVHHCIWYKHRSQLQNTGKGTSDMFEMGSETGASFAPKNYGLIYLTPSPKKFNMEAKVDLGAHQVSPKAELKVLGLWIHGKLSWGPPHQGESSENDFTDDGID